MEDRVILHCDLNNFFASVECLSHPEWREIPMAVCGSHADRHGIVLAKNEPAKKYGIKTAETIWQAKQKCPSLLIAPPHMELYAAFSEKARAIYSRYTDRIEPFGIDECWLDVTGSRLLFGSGEQIAHELRNVMKQELGLTISVGVSYNKIFAKLGSDYKKPDAVTSITRDNYTQIAWQLPSTEMLGVGSATAERLRKYGVHTIGDIANSDAAFLHRILGKCGDTIWRSANGLEGTQIAHAEEEAPIKSIGHSTTCPTDLQTDDEVWLVLYHLAEGVSERLRSHFLLAGGIQITVKDNDLQVKETQCALPYASRHPKQLAEVGMALFRKLWKWEKPVRLVGIRAISVVDETDALQYSLLYDLQKLQKLEQLEGQICSLRKRFGRSAVCRARLMKKEADNSALESPAFSNSN